MMSVVVGAALSASVSVGLATGQNAQKDAPTPVQVQEAVGRIEVVVTDPIGAVIPNAQVTLVNVPFAKIEGVTNGSGHFSLSHLRPGSYAVTVRSRGFMPDQTTINVPQEGIRTIYLSLGAPELPCTLCAVDPPLATIVSITPDFLPEPTADSMPAPSQMPTQRPERARNPVRRFFSSLRRKLGA
jgi:hypothetical protein